MSEATHEARAHGQMTAQMKAVGAPTTKRVLRVALIEEGRIVDEHTFEKVTRVTLGPTERDTFLIDDPAFGAGWTLIERTSKGRTLHVPPGSSGRVTSDAGTVLLDERSPSARTIPIDESARGRISFGTRTLLFSFDLPRAIEAVSVPLTIKRGLEIDWNTTSIAAFSFLLHFGLLGSIYSDWQDPIVDDAITIEGLVETLRDLPTATPEEADEQATTPAANAATAQADAKKPAPKQGATTGAKASGAHGPAPSSPSHRAGLAAELDSISLEMNAVLNTRGANTDKVISDGSMPMSLMEQAAASDAGNRPGSLAAFGRSGGAPTLDPRGSLADVGNRGGEGGADAGRARDAKGPTTAPCDGCTPDPGPTVPTGELPDAPGVIARLQGAFRRCYQNGLDREDDTMQGSLRITLRVGPNGEVSSATPSAVNGNLSPTVVACMVGRAGTAQFKTAPGFPGATLVVPIGMRKQK